MPWSTIVLRIAEVVAGGKGAAAVGRIIHRRKIAVCVVAELHDLCGTGDAPGHFDEHSIVIIAILLL